MIIVAGSISVSPEDRGPYLHDCVEVVEAARAAQGCIDFHLSADPVEPGRINIFEHWESVADVERFRGSGPSGEQQAVIVDAHVVQYVVESGVPLT